MTSEEIVRKANPDAFMSVSGRIWVSREGFLKAGGVLDKHPEDTPYFLGRGWQDAASRLNEGSQP